MRYLQMIYKYWLYDDNFGKLCDIVASNKLICLTGAGISTTLKLRNGNSSPDWQQLLINIKKTEIKKRKLKMAQERKYLQDANPMIFTDVSLETVCLPFVTDTYSPQSHLFLCCQTSLLTSYSTVFQVATSFFF